MESSVGQICCCTEQREGGKVVVSTEIYISKKMFQQQVTEDISDVVIYGL